MYQTKIDCISVAHFFIPQGVPLFVCNLICPVRSSMQGLKGSHVSKNCHDIISASIKFLNSLDRIQVVCWDLASVQYCSGGQKLSFFFRRGHSSSSLHRKKKVTSGTQGSGLPEMFANPQLISSSLNPKLYKHSRKSPTRYHHSYQQGKHDF